MHTAPVVGAPGAWSRDFALLGLALGGAAPFFVIADLSFAVVGAAVGALSGSVLGALSAWAVERARGVVPLPVIWAAMAGAGALQGAVTGVSGGATPTMFHEGGPFLGFAMGAVTGMVAMGLFFPVYLLLSVRRASTWPAVLGAVALSPFAGWAGLLALIGSTFGLWLFALPVVLWAGIALDRSTAGFTRERASNADPRQADRAYDRAERGRSEGRPTAVRA